MGVGDQQAGCVGCGWSIGEIPDEFLDAGAELYVIP